MLAIVASDKCYVDEILEKVTYQKEVSPNNTELFKCNYNDHVFIIMVTGYGKVNIGSSLRYLVDNNNVKIIISVGTAGSIKDTNDVFTAMIPNDTLMFDVDFMPCGYESAQIPKIKKRIYKTNDDVNDLLKKTSLKCGINYSDDLLVSSDMFVNNYNLSNSIRREYSAVACDCESAIVGYFCYVNEIEYSAVKVISNFANNTAIKQFKLYDEESSSMCQKIVYKFIKKFYEE